jgi:hypothetical protein
MSVILGNDIILSGNVVRLNKDFMSLPLYDNTFFYKSIKECLEKGFRSCKVCRPLSWEFSQVDDKV